MGVRGISVTQAKGYGGYSNFFQMNHCCSLDRIEIIIEAERSTEIAKTIIVAAHTGQPGDGIVDILPVDKLLRIRTQSEATADEI
jgi:nitrogen regulatory protein P-II 1